MSRSPIGVSASEATDKSSPSELLETLLGTGALSVEEARALTKKFADSQTDRAWFSVDAGIVDRLGRELVSKQETAVAELIKNAYDADATEVGVTFEMVDQPGGRLTIADNGDGMTRVQLLDGFMRISTTSKHGSERSSRLLRPRAGQKGIGRFSAQRLGTRLELETKSGASDERLSLSVHWDKFRPSAHIDGIAVPLRVERLPNAPEGTVLRVLDLREAWSDAQIQRVYRYVLGLLRPPYEGLFALGELEERGAILTAAQKKTLSQRHAAGDDRFQVNFLWERSAGAELLGLDEESMFFAHAAARFEVVVDGAGRAWMKFHSRLVGDDAILELPAPSRGNDREKWLALGGNTTVRGYYFIHDEGLIPKLFTSRVKEITRESGGFRIYRNGFRVLPYGTKDDDWAGLDDLSRKRSVLPGVANINWLAAVIIDEPAGAAGFVETASREGLVETVAFDTLRVLVDTIVRWIALRVAEIRGKKQRAGSRAKPAIEQLRDGARRIAARAQAQVEKASTSEQRAEWSAIVQAAVEVERATADVTQDQQLLLNEMATLRILAALGTTIGEFTHELRHLVGEIGNHLDALAHLVREGEIRAMPASVIQDLTQATRSLLTQAAYFDRAIADQAQREVKVQDLRALLMQFKGVFNPRAVKKGVSLEVRPVGDGLLTAPMHHAEWMSVFVNLYSNAERSVVAKGGDRRVRFECRRSTDRNEVIVQCSDTGEGISPDNRERIFDAFVTTSGETLGPDGTVVQGTGLGLYIVREILRARRGSIAVLESPSSGFCTTFEVRVPSA